MNFTADFVAKALYNIESIHEKVRRVYSTSSEDIFNIKLHKLPEWSLLYDMLFDLKQLDAYTKARQEAYDPEQDQ